MSRVSIVAAVLVAMLSGAWTGALAQTPTSYAVELVYDVRVGGLRAFGANGRILVDGDRYAAEAVFKKEGLVAALSQTFSGRNRVTGVLPGQSIAPRSGFSLIETRSTRTWQVAYQGEGRFAETHAPEMTVRPGREVTAQQKQGAVDPLTAAMLGIMQAGEPCGRSYRIFDSRRRFDVEMRRLAAVRPTAADGALLTGEGHACQAYIKKIAGYAPDDYDDAKANRNPPKLFLANINGARGWYPYRLEMHTSFGEVVGKLSSLKIVALTEAERASIRQ